jgi:hypothetical protein
MRSSNGDEVAEDLTVLRRYAERVVAPGAPLAPEEEAKASHLMTEYMESGRACGLTDAELVLQLYKGILPPRRGCECGSCRMRTGLS